ncbi:serine hydrolase domain-containing protein, partial [Staphylococcus aureus]
RETSKTERVTDPRLQDITVRMALNHTSGLPNWADGALIFEQPPGEKWQYSGEGYVLLQRAVEAVTGENLNTFMHRQVFQPL